MPARTGLKNIAVALTALAAGAGAVVVAAMASKLPARPAHGRTFETPPGAVFAAEAARSFRVATYNINSPALPIGPIAHDLEGMDFVALHEVRGGEVAEHLGRHLQMSWLYGPSERHWGQDAFGNAALCRLPVTSWHRIILPSPPANPTYQSAILVRCRVGSVGVNILTAHITLRAHRDQQLQALIDLFMCLEPPAVLLGDLNTRFNEPVLAELLAAPGVRAATELPPPGELGPVDWIIVRGLNVQAKGTLRSNASDHAMMWAQLGLDEPASPDVATRATSAPADPTSASLP
jgi:endonuclease/exonuclease/phosphatase family metal-dependent hydrolase